MSAELDGEALLVALVLSPATYSRNRFFELYTRPEVRKIRSRASQLRGIVRHVTQNVTQRHPAEIRELLCVTPAEGGRTALTYTVPALGLRRTAILEPIELSLIRFAMARSASTGAPLPPDDPDRLRIEAALERLAPRPIIPPSTPPV